MMDIKCADCKTVMPENDYDDHNCSPTKQPDERQRRAMKRNLDGT